MVSDLDRQLAAIAAKQHSLITLRQVTEAGGNKHSADTRVGSGRWEGVHDSVYRITGVPWTYEARVMAAVLAAGPGAVASHMCAARLHGIGFLRAKPEVRVPRGRNHRPKGMKVHTSTDLDRCQIVLIDNIPATDPARTLLDLGRFIGPLALGRATEKARRLGLATWQDVAKCVAVHARKGRHGLRRLREVIAAGAKNEGVTESDAELVALSLLREHGFDEPVLQHEVRDDDGVLIASMDFAYLDHRLVNFEVDGPHHLLPEQRRKDEARDHELRRRGFIVRRIWWEIPLHEPNEFVRIVRATLRDAENR